jgi:hypothetical protein
MKPSTIALGASTVIFGVAVTTDYELALLMAVITYSAALVCMSVEGVGR